MMANEIVDHLDKVLKAQPQPVQDAVDHAHGVLGLNASADAAANGTPAPVANSAPVSAPEGPQPIDASSGGVSPIVSTGSPSDAQPLPTIRPSNGNPSTEAMAMTSGAPPAPLQNPHMANLERMTREGAGWHGIHNPLLKGLAATGDVIGSGLFPEFARDIPGTTAHNEQLRGDEEGYLGQEQKAARSTVDVAHTGAETTEAGQKGEEEEARARALSNPQPKQEEAGKTITTDQGIMQWNPTSQRYDIKAGGAPDKAQKETGTVHQLEDGSLIVAHPDGSATAVTVDGKPVKGPAKEKPVGSPEQQFIDEYRAKHEGIFYCRCRKSVQATNAKGAGGSRRDHD